MKIHDFRLKKAAAEKISFLTCYDYPSALITAETPIDAVLVGDSVAMAVHGHPNTTMADIAMMELHTRAVARGLKKQFLVSDLPFLSHRADKTQVIHDVRRLIQAGAEAVKIEGADMHSLEVIHFLVESGVPVMGHIGLTPQSIHQLGGFKVQGKEAAAQHSLLQQAKALENAGCFALVIECTPPSIAKTITETLKIATIGIGAGADTDGQILVWHDMLGIQDDFKPRFLQQFGQIKTDMLGAIQAYDQAVKSGVFPAVEHCYAEAGA